jgi:hypothetical protein
MNKIAPFSGDLNEEIIRRPRIKPEKGECNQCNRIYLDDRFVPGYSEVSDSPAQIEMNKLNREICEKQCTPTITAPTFTDAAYVPPIPIASVKVIGGKTKTKKRSKKRGKKSKSIKKIFRRIKKK